MHHHRGLGRGWRPVAARGPPAHAGDERDTSATERGQQTVTVELTVSVTDHDALADAVRGVQVPGVEIHRAAVSRG